MLNLDLHKTEDWQDDWHLPVMFKAIGSSLHSLHLKTHGTSMSTTLDCMPPTQMDIFISLTELDVCLDDTRLDMLTLWLLLKNFNS